MRVFKPQRSRTALDVTTIEDTELRGVMEKLTLLQQETNQMNNGLSAQVRVAEQELQNMLKRMKDANQNLDDLISSIKTQVSNLVDASVKYVQSTQAGLNEDPKFRASFIYLLRDAVGNLTQVVAGLKDQAQGIIVDQPVEEAEGFEVSEEANTSPDMSPEPSSVVKTSSAKEIISSYKSSLKIAAVYQEIMKAIEKLEPIVESAKNVTVKNKELMGELQEVMGSVAQKTAPEAEETAAFSPEGGIELQENAPEEGIPEDEVGEAMDVEFEEPAEETPAEESEVDAAEEAGADAEAEEDIAEEDEGGEPAPEEDEEDEGGEPAPEEEEEIVEEETTEEAPKETEE